MSAHIINTAELASGNFISRLPDKPALHLEHSLTRIVLQSSRQVFRDGSGAANRSSFPPPIQGARVNKLWSTFLAVLFAVSLSAQSAGDSVPLRNWPAPLSWQPSRVEAENIARSGILRGVSGESTPHAQTPASSLVFVAMTPCRVVDTRAGRGFAGAFGPPSLAGGATRNFPILSNPTCSIPPTAAAYSFNVAVVPPGPLGFLTVWPGPISNPLPLASTLNDLTGTVVANAAIVQAGMDGSVNVFASNNTDLVIDINGYYVAQSVNGGGAAITPGTISIKEDFNNLVPATSPSGLIGTYGWSTSVSPANSGSFTSGSGGGDLNHAGIVQISAGAAVGATSILYLGDSSTNDFPFPDPGSTTNWTAYFVWKPGDVAVHNHGAGLTSFGGAGLFVFLKVPVSPNFLFVVSNAGGSASFDTGIAATSTDWWSLKLSSSTVGVVVFQLYKNGVPLGSATTAGTGQTMNIALPTGTPVAPFFQASSEAASSMTVLVDYFEFLQTGLAR
jgi:hypothetical protein